ncbi:MAG TPA: sigma-70 family RNA polymerase sigma factor [Gemmatimonadales bacterium]
MVRAWGLGAPGNPWHLALETRPPAPGTWHLAPANGSSTDTRDTTGFEGLLVPVLEPAYRTALRLTGNASEAEDLLQDASLLALRGFESFHPGSNFKAWFFRILLNRFYSNYRRQRRAGVPVELEEAPELYLFQRAEAAGLVSEADPAERIVERLDTELVTAALDALPQEYREAAALYFTQDLSYQEIAEVLNVPIGTVRSRLHRARRLLQKALWDLAEERGVVGRPDDGEPRP